jgi:hypothetical protein
MSQGADETPAPTIGELVRFLEDLGDMLAIADQVGGQQLSPLGWLRIPGTKGRVRTCRDLVPVRRLRMASPLEVVAELAPTVAGVGSALGALIYLIKRLWSIDLELRTSREEHRAAYYEAKELADVARARGARKVWGREISKLGENRVVLFREQEWTANEAVLVDWDEVDWV